MADTDSKSNSSQEEPVITGREENTETGFDFDEEFDDLTAGSQWFNPEPGTHEIKFLNNGEGPEKREYDGDVREVGIFRIEVNGEEKKWSVTKGRSESSLWGQLMKYGAAAEGLKGETITLIRQGEGTDTTYTVQEAADI